MWTNDIDAINYVSCGKSCTIKAERIHVVNINISGRRGDRVRVNTGGMDFKTTRVRLFKFGLIFDCPQVSSSNESCVYIRKPYGRA